MPVDGQPTSSAEGFHWGQGEFHIERGGICHRMFIEQQRRATSWCICLLVKVQVLLVGAIVVQY